MQNDRQENTEVFDFIRANPQAVLATVSEKSEPELAHVIVLLDDDNKAYFISKWSTRKIRNIRKHNVVSLIFHEKDTLKQAEYTGNADLVEDTKLYESAFERIQKLMKESIAGHWAPPAALVPGNKIVVVEITPVRIVYRDYSPREGDTSTREISIDC